MTIEPQLVWPVATELGEGPVWCADEAALRFVDITGRRLHRFDPATGERETLAVDARPSFIVSAQDGGFLVGSENAVFRFDGETLGPPVVTVDMPDHNRTNDATVDAAGRLWFGTMDDREEAVTGALHCLDRGVLRTTDWAAVVPNGPALSCDGRFLYHVNSGERTIWRIPTKNGSLASAGELFIQIDPADGYPDGVVVDSEDCLWVGLWDGWAVRRYGPDGTLLAEIRLPCARVTKVAFGGEDLKTAFVTTARVGLSDQDLAAQPLAGGLFAFPAPAAGRILPAVELQP